MVSQAVCARTSVRVLFTREGGDKGGVEREKRENIKNSIYQDQAVEVLFFLRAKFELRTQQPTAHTKYASADATRFREGVYRSRAILEGANSH